MSDPTVGQVDDPTPEAADLIVLSESARLELEQFRRDHETKVLTIFFSDLVGSTELQVEQGNLRAAKLVKRHYEVMRRTLGQYDGREISTAGDSMLIVFAAPSEAVKFALYAQQAMRQEHVQDQLLPTMRCGIHQGQVVLQKESGKPEVTDVYGVQVSMTARIMSLGQSEQILMSRAVFDDARTILRDEDFPGLGELVWTNHGAYRFKGIREECDVCEVGEKGSVVHGPPAAGSKAWPVRSAAAAGDPHDAAAAKDVARRRAILAGGVALLLIVAGVYATTRDQGPVPPTPEEAAQIARQKRLAEIEQTLSKISGVDEELVGLNELEKRYRAASTVIFGSTPTEVRAEALKFLSRLRTYELNDDERALVTKADTMATGSFVLYPEEVFLPVRQLAEMIAARKKALIAEREKLLAQ